VSAITDLPAPVAATLARWHAMIEGDDLTEVAELLHPEAEFSSPAYWKPYPGAGAVAHVLQTATSIFEDFAYHRGFATGDGYGVVLEFSARLDDLQLKGIDMIAFDGSGLITRFEVMIRPMKSLIAVAERMRASVDLAVLGKASRT
jgi:hypothetical protein